MPARTNSYQRLVLVINRMFASKEATITESKMLWDEKSEQHREIDIYIENTAGPYPISIGVECTAKKYKLDLPAVQQLIVKHQSVGINKTVIVSTHGFTESARNYAKKSGVELITFNAALKMKWPALFEQHKTQFVVTQKVTYAGGLIFVGKEDLESGFDPLAVPLVVELEAGPKAMADFALEQSGQIPLIDKEHLSSKPEVIGETEEVLEKNISYSPPIRVINAKGVSASINQLTFRYKVQRKITPIELSHGTYACKSVAHGEAANVGFGEGPFQNASVVLTESKSGHPSMHFEFRAKET